MNIMILGESPSFTRPKGQEDVPFSGKTSKILWEELKRVDLSRDDFKITNIVEEKITRKINKKDFDANKDRIKNFILENKIELVLCLGKLPSQFLLNREVHVLSEYGEVSYSKEFKTWVMVGIHPSAVARNPKLKNKFKEQVKLLKIILNNYDKWKELYYAQF